MGKLLIGLLIGLVLGGILTFYFFIGVPRAVQAPGAPIKPPAEDGLMPGSAQIILRQEFFNSILGAIFQNMQPPSFPISDSATIDCDSKLTILPQGSGVETGVRFENNTIAAPLAFSGSYASPVGCLQFTGWAQADLEMRFDESRQAVFGQINIRTVNLDGLNPIFNVLVTPIIQSTLNNRVNPIQILDGKQIGVNLPIAASNGNLVAAVKDVRAEVKDNALNLYVIYEFNGSGAQPQPQSSL